MKTKLILLALLVAFGLQAQVDATNYTATGVVEAEGKTASQIYGILKLQVTALYKDYSSVVKMDDPVNNTLVISGGFKNYNGGWNVGHTEYTITFQCRDGRYKYTIDNLVHMASGQGKCGGGSLTLEKPGCSKMDIPGGTWTKIKEKGVQELNQLDAMCKNIVLAETQGDDW